MTVLVTGGAGYIGSHTVVALQEAGHRVVIFDDLSNSSERAVDAVRALVGSHVEFVRGDAADADVVSRTITEYGVDAIVHFAAFKSVSESMERPMDYFANTMGALFGVGKAMEFTGTRKLIFSSSCAVYGEPGDVPVTEASATGAASPYGWTKLHGEQFLKQMAAAGELDVMLLRYFNPVGAHPSGTMGEDSSGVSSNLVPLLMQVALGRHDHLRVYGSDYNTPDGSPVRDYLHVVDLAEGHVAALDALSSNPGCTTLNIGTGCGYSVLQVVAAAEEVLQCRISLKLVDRRPGDVACIWAQTDLAADVLGWTATRDLAQMLEDHWRWQKAYPAGFGG